ncbi:haloacid dehalogenase [Heyndrickxia sporothermodurans]|nr:haloacid dehalogenase [Heyndrickxia sporothermodurans]
MIKAVLFDLDGTLLNRDASVEQLIRNQYDRFRESVGHIPKDTFLLRFIELECRGYVWKDKVYQQLVKEFHIQNVSWQELLEDYVTQFHFHCIPFPNLKRLLGILKCKGLALAIISNGIGQFQMNNVIALGIEKYFDNIFISEWEGVKKPNPQIFERAMHKLNVQANECVFIGDHPEYDIKAAQNIGMRTIWKKDNFYENVEADYVVNDLIDIVAIINEINRDQLKGKEDRYGNGVTKNI